ncbi:MAG: FAD-binding protein [Acidobacteria bacterium]|nr:MAG: FAD-binding protein [Acidobacteriota bacterium]REK03963.1 MAG: FAD-binding protein [Acidobacteriota bacterium]REK15125.1 MAG: FAD-binding protein [Acidobacteriota bacterium]REK46215.1 MAG: FAD-binding protein [Acidobacteriota bacterium]
MSDIPKKPDVAIVGAGPAGLSAALWCDELGLELVLLEMENEPGGQLLWTYNKIENYLGFTASNGEEIRDRFIDQVSRRDIRPVCGVGVSAVSFDPLELNLTDGSLIKPNALIIATGVRRNIPELPGIERFKGRGLIESGKRDKALAKDKTAIVVGGGDAAFENALILSQTAKKVFLIHRREGFRARQEFIQAVNDHDQIEILTNTEVSSLNGNESLESVSIASTKSRDRSDLAAELVIFRLGVKPNSEVFGPGLELDRRGYIRTDSTCRTNLPGVYAAGDVANPLSPTISSAAGMGSTAAKSIYSWLKG